MKKMMQGLAKRAFFRTLEDLRWGFLEIVCPEETYAFGDPGSSLRAMAVIHDERFFWRAVTGADIGIGESYMDGDWTSPDLVSLVRLSIRNLRLLDSSHKLLSAIRRRLSRVQHRLRGNTLSGSRRNIREHYDLGNGFYQLFLDPQMAYSCAYFLREDDTLETAQTQKFDLICRKLRIEPGDRVLEIGCGWGSFALYAARNYGARVTALTISPAQHAFARERFEKADSSPGMIELKLEDYRKAAGQFDKIVSIEMFEAVGFRRYDEFFGACDRLLAPNGSMLLQTITLCEQELPAYRKRVDWIQKHIFPGSELASLSEILRSLARSTQLSLFDSEMLGIHYAQTLACWRERFFQKLAEVRCLGFDERFQRMWDFYLAWCEGGFRERYINVGQFVFAKNGTQSPLLSDPEIRHRSFAHYAQM
jgi:cyclopropane-fatty-acyl-phospholipid synthase